MISIYIKLQDVKLSEVCYLCVRLHTHVCVRLQQVNVRLQHKDVCLHTQVCVRLQQGEEGGEGAEGAKGAAGADGGKGGKIRRRSRRGGRGGRSPKCRGEAPKCHPQDLEEGCVAP